MAVFPYTKPYLSPGDQVNLLLSRGMDISDRTAAEAALARIGYYRLSAYWYPFRVSYQCTDLQTKKLTAAVWDDFRPGTNFPLIFDIYVFDKKLRMIILDAIERIEVAVRTFIALEIGKAGPFAYRDPSALRGDFSKVVQVTTGRTKHADWLARVDEKFANSKEDFAKHFKQKYAGSSLPIWMSVELWDFGALSHFFAGMSNKDQINVAARFGIDWQTFGTWLRCLNDLRNFCAHHSRVWNRPLVNRPRWPHSGHPLLSHIAGLPLGSTTRLYAALNVLRFMLLIINPNSHWHIRLIDHVASLPLNAVFTETSAGFPYDWQAAPIWV